MDGLPRALAFPDMPAFVAKFKLPTACFGGDRVTLVFLEFEGL